MIKNLMILLFVLLGIKCYGQNLYIHYGCFLAINTTFMDSKTTISQDYINNSYLQNIVLLKLSKPNLGYSPGIYFKLQPQKSHLSFESGIYISKYNNTYKISVSYEKYFNPTHSWESINDIEEIENEFNIVNIPFIFGYDIIQESILNLTIFAGFSPNVNMRNDHLKYDWQNNELKLYKSVFVNYQTGISLNLNKMIFRLKYERTQNIKKTQSAEYFPYSMNVQKLYLNILSISMGIKIK
jgi:hypothetical protein